MTSTIPNLDLEQYPEILCPKMVAAYLDIGYGKALSLIKTGQIPCLKVGNHYKIPRVGFKAWLEKPGYRELL